MITFRNKISNLRFLHVNRFFDFSGFQNSQVFPDLSFCLYAVYRQPQMQEQLPSCIYRQIDRQTDRQIDKIYIRYIYKAIKKRTYLTMDYNNGWITIKWIITNSNSLRGLNVLIWSTDEEMINNNSIRLCFMGLSPNLRMDTIYTKFRKEKSYNIIQKLFKY